MALNPDDTLCFCFHVPLRKVQNFCAREKPQAASQISECLSAGTGCGWCVPMLRKIHHEICGDAQPWWRREPNEPAKDDPHADRVAPDDSVDSNAYAQGRQKYLKDNKITPPKDS